MLKALAQQERQGTRSRHRDAHAGPRDDLDLEMDALVLKQQQSNPGCAPPTTLRCRCSCACARHEHSLCLSLAVGKRRQMHGNSEARCTAAACWQQRRAHCAEEVSASFAGLSWKGAQSRLRLSALPSHRSPCACCRRSLLIWATIWARRCSPFGASCSSSATFWASSRLQWTRCSRPSPWASAGDLLRSHDGSRAWHHRDQRCTGAAPGAVKSR